MQALPENNNEGILKNWLCYLLPDEENGDIEACYCFYKNGAESILRIFDTRWMKPEFRELFWNTVQSLDQKLSDDDAAGYLIKQLYRCYTASLLNDYKQPEDENFKELFFVGDFKIGIETTPNRV